MDFLAGQGFDFNKFVYGVRSAVPPLLKQASDTSDSKHTHAVTMHGRHVSVHHALPWLWHVLLQMYISKGLLIVVCRWKLFCAAYLER